MEDIKKEEFVIFDVETTGLSPFGGDRVVEMAALKVKDSKIVDTFHSLIDPERPIPPGASAVNGISGEMIQGAPKAADILPRFLDFLGKAVLVGHNVKFDLSFLCYELALSGWWFRDEVVVVDTLKMARELLPHLGKYPLWFVAETLGIKKEQKHRALSDAELTFEVFCRLLKEIGRKDIETVGVLQNALEEYRGYRNMARAKQQGVFNW